MTRGTRWKLRIGLVIVAGYGLIAVFAPLLAPHDPLDQDVLNRLAHPSAEHWIGTDALGRDVLSRVIHGTRIDVPVALLAALLPAVIGTMLGAVAGFYGRLVDTIVMRIADLLQAFPVYVYIIALVFALGPGKRSIIIAFASLAWVTYARLVRTEVLRLRDLDFVHAARAGGLSNRRILFRHVMPNSLNQAVTYFPADVLIAVVALATFSFLGLGIPLPAAEWGNIIAEGQSSVRSEWWIVTVPGVVIMGLGVGLMLVADALDDRLRSR